jgi:hypothetical protein
MEQPNYKTLVLPWHMEIIMSIFNGGTSKKCISNGMYE